MARQQRVARHFVRPRTSSPISMSTRNIGEGVCGARYCGGMSRSELLILADMRDETYDS